MRWLVVTRREKKSSQRSTMCLKRQKNDREFPNETAYAVAPFVRAALSRMMLFPMISTPAPLRAALTEQKGNQSLLIALNAGFGRLSE
jgi:hypothetical protein